MAIPWQQRAVVRGSMDAVCGYLHCRRRRSGLAERAGRESRESKEEGGGQHREALVVSVGKKG